ncbi:type VI secretion system contractile sheath large subunit [Escherichia coli]|nr:type VI secretion system contractile sheath large subunit [Escherichia coli]EGK3844064.1 type VI secretion system contractile sheath large subunit [Escherichia coli]EHK6131706.1 type VI secretion system contractile sheath large subunit [Escherichia coli]EHM4467416.1 type VI secretion system contractile sheath large subunit [Escherichia coli]EHM4565781.1 type VI secretion system contractile sheath large subunit [Escherichia coli]
MRVSQEKVMSYSFQNEIPKTRVNFKLDLHTGGALNAVLHHPEFQREESLWRGVKYLVNTTNCHRNVKIELLDLSKGNLCQDFEDTPEIILFSSQIKACLWRN